MWPSTPNSEGRESASPLERQLEALAATGIRKCHLFVIADNENGAAFWRASGWKPRGDIAVFSKELGLE